MPRSHIAGAVLVCVGLASPAPAVELLGTFDTSGTALDVELANGLVYLADGSAGIRIFDVTTPSAPVQLGVYDTPGTATQLAVDGTRVYVASGGQGMHIVDATNPAAPALLGVAAASWVDDVAVRNGFAYVVDRFAGFLVFDVADPAAPTMVGSLPSLLNDRSILLRGEVAYLAGPGGAHQVDISIPTAPVVVGGANYTGVVDSDGSTYYNDGSVSVAGTTYSAATTGINALDFDVFDRFVVTADATSIGIWDFSGPFEPDATRLSSVSFGTRNGPWVQDLHVLAGRAYIAVGDETSAAGSLQIYDVIDPANPIPLGVVYAGQSVRDVEAVTSGGRTIAYTAQRDAGLAIADVTNPAAPVLLGSYDSTGDGEGIDVEGDLAYLAAGTQGLLVLDVSDPAHPVLRGSLDTPGAATAVVVRAGVAWVADDYSNSVRIIDVSNPASPLPIGSLAEADRVWDIALAGDLAYVGVTEGGLHVYNVANPSAPVSVGSSPVFAWSVAVAGRALWLNTRNVPGTVKLDVTDPSHPETLARIPGAGPGRFAAAGRLLYGLGGNGESLAIWDGNTATSLHHDAALLDALTGFTPKAMVVDAAARRAWVADGAGGLRVVDFAADIAALPCRNTDDDDGDGLVDAADLGCRTWDDPSEKPDCDDGLDQDGDGLIDYPADPGCKNTLVTSLEDPQCQDGVDNEGDGAIDYPADTRCRSRADDDELTNPSSSCGIGAELLGLSLVPLWRRRAQMRRSRPCQ